MAWTDERIETLKKGWADGLSCSQIAAELGGVTRNAVIGKVHRLGLNGRQYVRPQPSSTSTVKGPGRRGGNVRQKLHRENAVAAARTEPLDELAAETPANPIGVVELEEHHCRWPCSGEGLETIFCGGTSVNGLSYCPRHSRMAYRAPERRSRAELEIEQRKLARARAA